MCIQSRSWGLLIEVNRYIVILLQFWFMNYIIMFNCFLLTVTHICDSVLIISSFSRTHSWAFCRLNYTSVLCLLRLRDLLFLHVVQNILFVLIYCVLSLKRCWLLWCWFLIRINWMCLCRRRWHLYTVGFKCLLLGLLVVNQYFVVFNFRLSRADSVGWCWPLKVTNYITVCLLILSISLSTC